MESRKVSNVIDQLLAIEMNSIIRKRQLNFLQNAVSALEYRVKKSITERVVYPDGSKFYKCPSCRVAIEREYQKYCCDCGQCLNWRGVNTITCSSLPKLQFDQEQRPETEDQET